MSGLNRQERVRNHAERLSHGVGKAECILMRALHKIEDGNTDVSEDISLALDCLAAPYERRAAQ